MKSSDKLHITVLGSGTSTGIPVIGCKCNTCLSSDHRDKRLRCSLWVRKGNTSVIIDTGPDFRQQVLTHGIDFVDAIVYTHFHNDHIAGFDDIRGFNFSQHEQMVAYADNSTISVIKRTFPYAFGDSLQVGGGLPQVNFIEISTQPFVVGDLKFEPLELMHGKLPVKGFRIGDFAYCTDTNYIPNQTIDKLRGLKYLIIDGLRPEKHPTHYNISESLQAINQITPQKAYLTHIAHQIRHSELEGNLPENVYIAYDGLTLTL